ncbi:hypothetical protein [Micromonospora sp. 067-2]|uniref:hypothetical protein n=1 Tax=Micromonospora sp. 067-2 TaxID=2789270 RepID=UPI003977FD2E
MAGPSPGGQSILAGKVNGYRELFGTLGRAWPVLLWLHSAVWERNLRRVPADVPLSVPLATGARANAATAGLGPAGTMWAVAVGEGQRLRLADLAGYVVDVASRRVRPRDWRRHDSGGRYLRCGSDNNGRRLSRTCRDQLGRC